MPTNEGEGQSQTEVIRKMIEPLRSRRFTCFPGPVWLKLLASVSPDTVADLRAIQLPLTSLIALQPEVSAFLQSIDKLDDLQIIEKSRDLIFLENLNAQIVHLLLRKLINQDAVMEQALTSLRRAYLQYVFRQPAGVQPQHLHTMATIAAQCFNNEYVFYQTAEEEEICKGIFADGEPGDSHASAFVAKVVAYAMYHPLHSLSLRKEQMQTLSQYGASVQDLIDRQIKDDAIEKKLAAGMPAFGQIENTISKKVRQQYEEAPYPRWLDFVLPKPQPFAAHIEKKFPFLEYVPPAGTIQCLVAGCGTGKHAIKVATRFTESSVVAIDLSRRSLAYGARQASRYGISNIEFFHGDILQVGALKRDFDLIEAVGSLHHLEDTSSGIQALAEALRPGGFMKIAVYRRSFRDLLKPAREFVWGRLKTFTTSELQTIRHALIRQKDFDIETEKAFVDFYYTSGFRDLLCHVQELSFTPREIKAMLEKLHLQFLGIDYSDNPAIKTAFLSAHPDKSSSRDLDVYEEFEASRTEEMPSLLEFWVRKNG